MTDTFSYFDGFNRQNDYGWTGSQAFDTATKSPKSLSPTMRLNLSNATAYMNVGAGGWHANSYWLAAGNGYGIWAYFKMYVATLPGGGQYFYLGNRSSSGTTYRIHVRLRSDGKFDMGQEGTWDTTSAAAISTETWYQVSLLLKGNGVSYLYVRDINGSTIVTMNRNTGDQADAAAQLFAYSNSYGDIYIGDLVIESGADANIADPWATLGWDYGEQLLYPTGAGTASGWTGTYADVDDVPEDGDTTKLSIAYNATAAETYDMCAFNAGYGPKLLTPQAVAVISHMRSTGGGGSYDAGYSFYSGATNYTGVVDISGTTTYRDMKNVWKVDPVDSGAWTEAKINACEAGATKTSSPASGTPDTYCTSANIAVLGTTILSGLLSPMWWS